MKKLLLTVLAGILLMPALTVSADYYDCAGQVRPGNPAPGECHRFIIPEDESPTNVLTPSDTSGRTSSTNILTPSGSSGRTSSTNSLTPSGSSGRTSSTNSLTPSGSSGRTSSTNILTPSGKASDLRTQPSPSYQPEVPGATVTTDPNDYYKKYFKKNIRDYCVRDVCYVLYDYCYDDIHCEPKKDVVSRNEYDTDYEPYNPNYTRNVNNTWNYWVNYYVNNYFYGMPACDSRYQRCVYRGYHFGQYHNGYWPAFR